jgi:chromosomal replication initiation ATPase DnaA
MPREQTFNSFVVRPTNRAAYKYLLWVSARRPTRGSIVLRGASGSGKSHLLRACVHAWKERNPQLKVVAVSATDLLRDYVLPGLSGRIAMSRIPSALKGDVLIIEHLESLAAQPRSLEAVLVLCARLMEAKVRLLLSITAPVVGKTAHPLASTAARALRPNRVLSISGNRFVEHRRRAAKSRGGVRGDTRGH